MFLYFIKILKNGKTKESSCSGFRKPIIDFLDKVETTNEASHKMFYSKSAVTLRSSPIMLCINDINNSHTTLQVLV